MNNETLQKLTSMDRFGGIVKPYQENIEESEKAKREVEAAREAMQVKREVDLAKGEVAEEETFATKKAEIPQRKEIEKIYTAASTPFIPTRDNAASLAAIFALTNIAGFAIGAGGKRNAQAAMAGMNGMLEGYQKGRVDLYKKEKDVFDTNIKRLKTQMDMLDRQIKDAEETLLTNRQLGLQKLKVAFAQAGADFYRNMEEKRGVAAMLDHHKAVKREVDQLVDRVIKEQQRADDKAAAERRHKETMAQTATLARERIAAQKEARAERDSKLSPVEKKEVRGFERLQDEVALLKDTFKPEYANFVADAAGDVVAKAKERLQNDPGMAEWWRRYENVALPERHSMFGATLTGKEQQSWRKASVGPGNSSQQILNWIADKERTLERNLKQYERPTAAASSQQVRTFNTVQEAEAANLPKGTQITIGGKKAVVE